MHLHVSHRTTFDYAGRAHESVNEARLRPVDDATQRCLEFTLRVTPDATPRDYEDFYGNVVQYFEIFDSHNKLIVEATSRVDTIPMGERLPVPSVPLSELLASADREMLAEFYSTSEYVPLDGAFREEAEEALCGGFTDAWSDVRRLGEYIHSRFAYRPNATAVDTRATDVIKLRQGVCQDFAHVHLGLCRSLGIPSRYVSGYFFDDARGTSDGEASHAWIEAWLPGFGWAAFDATHARVADDRYVKVAVGRDYADIRPVNGTYRGAPTRSMTVDVAVREASPDFIST